MDKEKASINEAALEELRKASEPMVMYMRQHHCIMDTALITCWGARVVAGEMGTPFDSSCGHAYTAPFTIPEGETAT